MCKLCVFAGTGEGRELIDRLSGRGARITACVATEYGEAILGGHADVEVCHGRMDRAEMADFLRRGKFDAVIDATHPYAGGRPPKTSPRPVGKRARPACGLRVRAARPKRTACL